MQQVAEKHKSLVPRIALNRPEAGDRNFIGIDGMIILERKRGWEGVDWVLLRVGNVAGPCEHDNKPSGFIKGEKLVQYLSDLVSQEGICSIELVS
jgi:hypothetical protein